MTVLFWGDINFPSSRAIDDEEEESDVENELYMSIDWSAKVAKQQTNQKGILLPLNCTQFIFAIGANAIAFSETYLLKEGYEVVGNLSTVLPKGSLVNKSGTKDCIFIRQNSASKIIFCHLLITLNQETHDDFISMITTNFNIQKSSILVITSFHYSNLKLESLSQQLPCMRKLTTDYINNQIPICPYLEQPNVVSGIAASIMTYSQIHKLGASLYIVYSEAFYADITTIEGFHPLLKLPEILNNIDIQKDDSCARKKMEQIIGSKSTGYLFT